MPQLPYDRLAVLRVGTTGEYYRILWSDTSDRGALRYVIIAMQGPLRMPTWISAENLAANVAEGLWTPIEENPFKFSFRSEADLPADPATRRRYKTSQQRKLRYVRMVTALGRDTFIGRLREARIRELVRDRKGQRNPPPRGSGDDFGTIPCAGAIRKWLILFWRSGEDPAALYPRFNQRGRKPYSLSLASNDARPQGKPGPKRKYPDINGAMGCDLHPADRARLLKGAREFLFTSQGRHLDHGRGLPWRQAHKATLAKHFSESIRSDRDEAGNVVRTKNIRPPSQRPTLAQFHTIALSDADLAKRIKRVEGERAYNTRFRPLPGNSLDLAQAPGAVFQVDWMVAKIWLVSRIDGKPCGWVYVFFVIDVFSRMIVGVYVTFEYPDYRAGAMALLEAMSDKVKFAARYDVMLKPEDWPCHHQPAKILNDGGELASKLADYVPEGVSDLATAPAYRPDLKAVVERCFGVSKQSLIEWQGGSASSDRPADAPDPRVTSRLTIEKFTAELIHWTVFEHNRRPISKMARPLEAIREDVDPIPIELWNWGIRRLGGRLRSTPRAQLIPRLMPRVDAKVNRRGLEVDGVRYFSNSAHLQHLIHEAPIRGRNTIVQVVHDPDNTNEIYLINPKIAGGFETIRIAANSPYAGMTFLEVRKQIEADKDRQKYLQGEHGARAVEAERLRQQRAATAEQVRKDTLAAAADVSDGSAARPPSERKAEEIRRQLSRERAANATVPPPRPADNSPPPLHGGISRPMADRLSRLKRPHPTTDNP